MSVGLKNILDPTMLPLPQFVGREKRAPHIGSTRARVCIKVVREEKTAFGDSCVAHEVEKSFSTCFRIIVRFEGTEAELTLSDCAPELASRACDYKSDLSFKLFTMRKRDVHRILRHSDERSLDE